MLEPEPHKVLKNACGKFLLEFCYFEVIFVFKNFLLSYLIFYKAIEPLERVDPTICQKTDGPIMVEIQVCVCVSVCV